MRVTGITVKMTKYNTRGTQQGNDSVSEEGEGNQPVANLTVTAWWGASRWLPRTFSWQHISFGRKMAVPSRKIQVA